MLWSQSSSLPDLLGQAVRILPCSSPSGPDSPDDWTSQLSLSCMCLALRTGIPSHATILYRTCKTVSSRGGLRAGQTLWRGGRVTAGSQCASWFYDSWGLVPPEEMAEVIFRALHSFTQQVVIKNLCSCPHSQMVNKARSLSAMELIFQPFLRRSQWPTLPPSSSGLSIEQEGPGFPGTESISGL